MLLSSLDSRQVLLPQETALADSCFFISSIRLPVMNEKNTMNCADIKQVAMCLDRMRPMFLVLILAVLCGCPDNSTPHLPSWEDGNAKHAILNFVKEVTTKGDKNFVEKEERRAVFDLDGTIIVEKPEYIEVAIAKKKLKEKIARDMALYSLPLFKAVLSDDLRFFESPDNVKDLILEAFDGESLDAYFMYNQKFLKNEMHPGLHRPYGELIYAPIAELMEYLHQNGFAIYVVSTSQQEFIQALGLEKYGVFPQNAIGTVVGFEFMNLTASAPPTFVRKNKYFDPYNSGEDKVVRLRERVLLPAIFAFGNSWNDYAMLDATADSGLPHFVGILIHDDPAREKGSYNDDKLEAKAKQRDWNTVSVKNDFKEMFLGK